MANGPVVSNTTPLIVLAGIGQLTLLPSLYQTVWIPTSVHAEFQAGAADTDPDLAQLPWLVIHAAPQQGPRLPQLDQGEADTIRLALSVQARAVLLDERLGRRAAQELGLPVVGTLAVLLRAKQHGLIEALEPLLDEMITQGRHISTALRQQVLEAAGEA